MKLALYLEKTGILQRELADKIGTHQQNVSEWALGLKTPNLASVAKIQRATGGKVGPQDFMPQAGVEPVLARKRSGLRTPKRKRKG